MSTPHTSKDGAGSCEMIGISFSAGMEQQLAPME